MFLVWRLPVSPDLVSFRFFSDWVSPTSNYDVYISDKRWPKDVLRLT